MKKVFVVFLLFSLWAYNSKAQIQNPVKWNFSHKQIGNLEYELQFHATIDEHWHLYSEKKMESGPIATSLTFSKNQPIEIVGGFKAKSKPVQVFDKNFNMNVEYFGNQVTFIQNIKLLASGKTTIEGYIEFMCCDDETCLPPTEAPFSIKINPAPIEAKVGEPTPVVEEQPKIQDTLAILAENPIEQTLSEPTPVQKGMFLFLLLAFLAGLAAIITPCVFPMIPMTVSFFMRGNQGKGKAIRTALFFGASIVLIYTLLGALFSFGVFGPNVGTILSTHWVPNALFFILFLIFALSFFGLFELVLPGNLANKTDAKADKGGLIGAFFMALTTVIVSFSCTGPFIGYLIIEAVQGGGLRPLLGMFTFGLAFALPFTLLAIFPSAIKKLPKSGGWLNSVKVVFAFILLAFGMKFLSNIDQVYGFNLISRELYLSIWIVLFVLLGMYFLGKIKFPHDSDLSHLGVGRFLLAVVSLVFSLYLFTGLLGKPLTAISSLIPPPSAIHTVAWNNPVHEPVNENAALCGPAEYADKLHLPHGLSGYFEFNEALSCAREQNKPLFVVFKGHACANCKKMENTVWNDPEVLKILRDRYVLVALYTDDRTELPESKWVVSSIDGKTLKSMGRVNLDLLMVKYNKNTIPYHVVIEPDGTERQLAVTYNIGEFKSFLGKSE